MTPINIEPSVCIFFSLGYFIIKYNISPPFLGDPFSLLDYFIFNLPLTYI